MTHKIEGQMPTPRVTAPLANRVAVSGTDRSEPVQGSAGGDSLRLTGEATSLLTMQRDPSSTSPLDQARVADIRAALQAGTYKVDAQAIAGRMLDLEDQLGS